MIPQSQNTPVWGILLAAGKGSRFQKERPGADKLLAPLPAQAADASLVLQQSLRALAAHTTRTLVIIHPEQNKRHEQLLKLKKELARQQHPLTLLSEPGCSAGMGASLALAARYGMQSGATPPVGVLIALADMPWIKKETYQAVARALIEHPIAAPFHGGKRGHPVGFQWSLMRELSQLSGDAGARALLETHGCHRIISADPGVLMDIDRPGDLQQMRMD